MNFYVDFFCLKCFMNTLNTKVNRRNVAVLKCLSSLTWQKVLIWQSLCGGSKSAVLPWWLVQRSPSWSTHCAAESESWAWRHSCSATHLPPGWTVPATRCSCGPWLGEVGVSGRAWTSQQYSDVSFANLSNAFFCFDF